MRFVSLFVSTLPLLVASSSLSAGGDGKAGDGDDSKLQIELYYESQCPGCRETITSSFKEAFHAEGFGKMATVSWFPFGNAKETNTESPYEFQCQHGPSECNYNLIEACILKKISCPMQQFELINCIESNDEDRNPKPDRYAQVLIGCSMLAGVEKSVIESIHECAEGPEGNALMHDLAAKTAALDPPHKYVPWIVVNGKHDDKMQDEIMTSLLKYVCDNYKGADKSPECPDSTMLRGSLRPHQRITCTGRPTR